MWSASHVDLPNKFADRREIIDLSRGESFSTHRRRGGEIGREGRAQHQRAHEMQRVTATFRNGRVELTDSVDWPDGTQVEVTPLGTLFPSRREVKPPMTQWPDQFFDRLREQWGAEPFERPPQGEFEIREDW